MKFSEYLMDRRWSMIFMVLMLLSTHVLMLLHQVSPFYRLYLFCAPVYGLLLGYYVEYIKRKQEFDRLNKSMEQIDELYLFHEVIEEPESFEGKVYVQVIQEIGRSTLTTIANCENQIADYKDFIELWIHEVKTPIAAGKMLAHSQKSFITEKIEDELDKIDNYTEEALFYARSNSVEKDYLVSSVNLNEIVKAAIIKNKNLLISNQVSPWIGDLDVRVLVDKKWLTFILSQIIQNSVKYMKTENRRIDFRAERMDHTVVLNIRDNGIGIRESDVQRVFEKGFTGENGRNADQKSTGIGLYLCKKLCNKMDIGISLTSKEGEWTCVSFQLTAAKI